MNRPPERSGKARPHHLRAAFGKRLRETRESLNQSQEDFGLAMGVNRISQYHYETGLRPPSLDYLLQMQDQGVDVAALLKFSPRGRRPRAKPSAGDAQ